MSDFQHTDDLDCRCGPKRVTFGGQTIDLHKPVPMGGKGKVRRRRIAGLPPGWVIVGNKSRVLVTEGERDREAEAFEHGRRNRDKARKKNQERT